MMGGIRVMRESTLLPAIITYLLPTSGEHSSPPHCIILPLLLPLRVPQKETGAILLNDTRLNLRKPLYRRLSLDHVRGLGPLGTLGDVEFDLITLG
jgi:hypothetical protein